MSGITVPTNAYCTLIDLQGLLPNRKYDATSKPTAGQVEMAIKEVAQVINAIVRGLGFTPPLTTASDVMVLKSINQYGAAWRCESATLIGVQGKSELAEQYKAEYDAMIKNLIGGVYKFEGAGGIPSAEPDGQDDLDASGTRSEPIFSISIDERERQF